MLSKNIFKTKVKKNKYITYFLCLIVILFTGCGNTYEYQEVVLEQTEENKITNNIYFSEDYFYNYSDLKDFSQNYEGKTVKIIDRDGNVKIGTFEKTKVTFSEEELSLLPVPYIVEDIPQYGHSFFPLNNIKYIVVHNTANPKADAAQHYYYINTNEGAITSAHFYVDDTQIIQALPTNMECWSVGLNEELIYQGITNANSINIEICETGDIDKAIDNAMYLIRELLHPAFPEALIVRHYDATLKECPRYITGMDWNIFLANSYGGQIPENYYEELGKTKIIESSGTGR